MLGTNSELIDNSMVNISVDSTSDVPEAFAQTPQSLKMDLVLSHFSYTITDIPDISETYISNLFNDLLYSIKLATGQQKMRAKPILSDINLIFPCGSSTLIVGAPGCGSTSLLNAIYGNLENKYLSGNIKYNNKPISEYKNWKRIASYCSQYDYHNALLSAKETLEFARQCQYGNESFHEKSHSQVNIKILTNKVDDLCKTIGLEKCKNTYLGGMLVKGCSGGEKRRVTVGEMLLGFHKILLLDKFSTGLDSAITKDITKFLTSYAKEMNNIVITALLQPDPEIIPYFDQLIILEEGSIIYCGTPFDAVTYFSKIGYKITGNTDVGSFLSNIGNETYRKLMRKKDAMEKAGMCLPQSVDGTVVELPPLTKGVTIESIQTPTLVTIDSEDTTTSPQPPQLLSSSSTHISGVPLSRLNKSFNHTFHHCDIVNVNSDEKTPMVIEMGNMPIMLNNNSYQSSRRLPYDHSFIKKYELIHYYESSGYYSHVEKAISKSKRYEMQSLESGREKGIYTAKYSLSFLSMLAVIFKRQSKLVLRDKFYLIGVMIGYLIAGVFIGFVFYDITSLENKLTVYGVFLFYLILMTLGPVAEFGSVLEQRRVLAKQITGKYFSIPTFVLSSMVVQWPFMILQPLFCGIPIYFISELSTSHNYKHFLLFCLCGIATSFAVTPLFRLFMFGFSSEFVALGTLPLMIFIMSNFTGYSVPYDKITWVLRWIYYINPLSYGHKILSVNEFLSGDYGITGPANLAALSFPTDDKDMWKWFVILIVMHFIFTLLTIFVLHCRKWAAEYSIIATDKDIDVDEAEDVENTSSINEGVSLVWKNLNVFVNTTKGEKQLLYDINGYAKPGTLTALMGASGAGKSTLLDALSHTSTKTRVTGDILFNGQKLSLNTQSHVLGYVEQADNLPTKETVEEVLFFNARLRLSSKLTDDDIHQKVDEVVKVLSLEDYRKIIIGNPGSGISMAIRKLIMTGIELVADPAILFLDEPTTGLDSKSALMVVKVLNRIAEYGKCVVCTIHQPSFEIFQLFSNILLLESGGKTVYLGDTGMNGIKLVNYFHEIREIPRLQDGKNPASWILEVTGAGTSVSFKSYAENYINSELKKANEEEIEYLIQQGNTRPKLNYPKYMTSLTTQIYYYSRKIAKFYWRSTSYSLSRLIVTMFISLVLGGLYYQTVPNTISGVTSFMSSLFSCSLFIGVFSAVAALPALASERNSIYRDIDKHLVSPFAVLHSFTISEIPYSLLCCIVGTAIIYPMVGYSSEISKVLQFLLFYFAFLLFTAYLGQWIAFTSPSIQISLFGTMAFLLLMNCISGFIIPNKDLVSFFQILNYINPINFFFTDVSTTQLHCDSSVCTNLTLPTGITVDINYYLTNVLDLHFDKRWKYFIGTIAYIFVSRIAMALSLLFVRYLP